MIFCATVVLPLALPPQIPITNGSTCWPIVLYHGGRPASQFINEAIKFVFETKKNTQITGCVNSSVVWNPDDRFIGPDCVLACWGRSLTTRAIASWCRSYPKAWNRCGRRWQCRIVWFTLEATVMRVTCPTESVFGALILITEDWITKNEVNKLLIGIFCKKHNF